MNSSTKNTTAVREIDAIIKKFDDWRGVQLANIRKLIKEADPEVLEEVKWKAPSNPDGVPVWSHDGIICNGETYKKHLRISFAKVPALKEKDPKELINTYRAIIIHEEDKIDEAAFKNLINAAVQLNQEQKKKQMKQKPVGTKHRIYTMSVARVYPEYVAKAERKGRTKVEVDEIIHWLTGYSQKELERLLENQTDFETFFATAPQLNPARKLITGVICGVRVEEIKERLMQEIRYLDKLIDELAKGKAMEKILRK